MCLVSRRQPLNTADNAFAGKVLVWRDLNEVSTAAIAADYHHRPYHGLGPLLTMVPFGGTVYVTRHFFWAS